MNEVWNLDPIYKGFDDPVYASELTACKEKLQEFEEFTKGLAQLEAKQGLQKGIELQETIEALLSKLALFAMLRQAANTRDTEAASQMGRLMAIYSAMAAPLAAFREWISKISNLEELVQEDEQLREYRFMLGKIAESSRYLLPGRGEEIMARMGLSGGNAWSDLQSYLTSTVPVEYNGGITNLSSIRNLAYDPDPSVRKAAYEAEIACYDRIKDAVAFALNSIKLETISDCQLRGYESPLARTLKQSDMKRETLDAMLAAMDEYAPKFWQYLKAKARALGYQNGLPWYELFAPMGKASSKFTTEEAKEYLLKQFSTFDQQLTDMVAEAFDNAWIDFYPRDGKTGGAFCAEVFSIGESRILTNYDGQLGDVVTLAHELGHAFHNLCVMDHKPLNREYSMPVAETASTFNECVVMAAAIESAATDEERMALIESQLQDATQCICDIYSRFRFEAKVFENREENFMNADAVL